MPTNAIYRQLTSGVSLLPAFTRVTRTPLPTRGVSNIDVLPLLRSPSTTPIHSTLYLCCRSGDLRTIASNACGLVFPRSCLTCKAPNSSNVPNRVVPHHIRRGRLCSVQHSPNRHYGILSRRPRVTRGLRTITRQCHTRLNSSLANYRNAKQHGPKCEWSQRQQPTRAIPRENQTAQVPQGDPIHRATSLPSAPKQFLPSQDTFHAVVHPRPPQARQLSRPRKRPSYAPTKPERTFKRGRETLRIDTLVCLLDLTRLQSHLKDQQENQGLSLTRITLMTSSIFLRQARRPFNVFEHGSSTTFSAHLLRTKRRHNRISSRLQNKIKSSHRVQVITLDSHVIRFRISPRLFRFYREPSYYLYGGASWRMPVCGCTTGIFSVLSACQPFRAVQHTLFLPPFNKYPEFLMSLLARGSTADRGKV